MSVNGGIEHEPVMKQWGFDPETIDHRFRPQDDFYRYANGEWMKTTSMPSDESRWGTFSILGLQTEQQLKKILDDLAARNDIPEASSEQLVGDLFHSAMDAKRRDALGLKPIEPWREMIRRIGSTEDMTAYLAKASRSGISGIWGSGIGQDDKDSTRYALHFFQGGLGMLEREYYLSDAPEQVRVREAYVSHIAKLLRLAGETSEQKIAHAVEVIMRIETRLARASMTKKDRREIEKTYHKLSLDEFSESAPHIDVKRFLSAIGAENEKDCVVTQPEFFAEVSRMFDDVPLDDWKVYLEFRLINGASSALSRPFVEERFDFYGRILTGQDEMKPDWRRALGAVDGAVGDALGQLYVRKHFDEKAKQRIDSLVSDLFEAYEKRIRALEWMSPETKQKALAKLRRIVRKIGYPSRWKDYSGLVIKPDDFFGNVIRANEHEHEREIQKLGKPIDREEWFMGPQEVNAYFSPNMNDIVFPAGILQPPFFDQSCEDDAVNYASIGAVIGHELTHGFDDQGAKFDEEGNWKNWWTEEDKKRFEEKTKVLVTQFDAYEIAPGIHANGQLTLGENIADLGGLTIAFDAYQKRLLKTGREDIGGFTPEQRFFLGFAQAGREIEREESMKTRVITDPHSNGEFRVNGPLSNFEEFYKAFSIKEGDKLYRPPEERAKIW